MYTKMDNKVLAVSLGEYIKLTGLTLGQARYRLHKGYVMYGVIGEPRRITSQVYALIIDITQFEAAKLREVIGD